MEPLTKSQEKTFFRFVVVLATYYMAFGWGAYFILKPPLIASTTQLNFALLLTGLAAFMYGMTCIQFKVYPVWARLIAWPFVTGYRLIAALSVSLSLETH